MLLIACLHLVNDIFVYVVWRCATLVIIELVIAASWRSRMCDLSMATKLMLESVYLITKRSLRERATDMSTLLHRTGSTGIFMTFTRHTASFFITSIWVFFTCFTHFGLMLRFIKRPVICFIMQNKQLVSKWNAALNWNGLSLLISPFQLWYIKF